MSSLVGSGLAITAAVLIGRLLGFGRDATIAATMGIDRNADIAVFLISLPDFLINVLGAGGFTAILVVTFRQKPEIAARLMMQSGMALLAAVGVLSLLLILVSGPLVDALAPGFADTARLMTIALLPLVLLSAPVTTLAGPFRAYLLAQERFFIAASGTMIVNGTLIVGLLVAPENAELYWLAWAVMAAALLRVLVLAAGSGRATIEGFRISPWHVDLKLVAAFARAAATEAIAFLYPLALRAIATLFGTGALASTNYATKLVLLPLGVLVMTLTTILLPRLAAAAPREDGGDRAFFVRLIDLGGYWILGDERHLRRHTVRAWFPSGRPRLWLGRHRRRWSGRHQPLCSGLQPQPAAHGRQCLPSTLPERAGRDQVTPLRRIGGHTFLCHRGTGGCADGRDAGGRIADIGSRKPSLNGNPALQSQQKRFSGRGKTGPARDPGPCRSGRSCCRPSGDALRQRDSLKTLCPKHL